MISIKNNNPNANFTPTAFGSNFGVAHVAGSMNTAPDFQTAVDSPIEKLELSLRNEIQTKAMEVNMQSSGIEEEQIYILLDEKFDENQLWEEKQNVRNQAQI